MRLIGSLAIGTLILAGGYFLSQRPEIRELFRESKSQGDPLAFLEKLPELTPKQEARKPPGRQRKRSASSRNTAAPVADLTTEEIESSPEDYNQVPNEEVRKVLMQILAAKKLSRGISLSVTDRLVTVTGEVSTSGKRKQILDIIERGREARSIDATRLAIRN
jgi:hypothetical protein